MLYYERKLKKKGFKFIIGVDEVGRGPLAGPVLAGAVFLKEQRFKNRIFDSKKLSPSQRERAFFELIKKSAFHIGLIDEKTIDRVNILEATRLAMQCAIEGLIRRLDCFDAGSRISREKICLLVDGNIRLDTAYPYLNIIKGDSRSRSIAAASILAKFIRDRIMSLRAKTYPQYGFLKHKGYPTRMHRRALEEYGPSVIHRKTFLKKIIRDYRCLEQV